MIKKDYHALSRTILLEYKSSFQFSHAKKKRHHGYGVRTNNNCATEMNNN